MLRFCWLVLLAAASACSTAERSYNQSLPSDGVTTLFSDNDAGDVLYSGTNPDSFEIDVRVFSKGATRSSAENALSKVEWGVAITDGVLDMWGRTRSEGGVDFTVEGPPEMSAEIVLLSGAVQLHDLVGNHIVTADRVEGSGLVGDLDLLATSEGMEIEAWPEPGALIVLDSVGETTLALPYGLDYDLEVFADPDWGTEITDLGFDRLDASPDYVRAVRGSGGIRVEVTVDGGPFSLWITEP